MILKLEYKLWFTLDLVLSFSTLTPLRFHSTAARGAAVALFFLGDAKIESRYPVNCLSL